MKSRAGNDAKPYLGNANVQWDRAGSEKVCNRQLIHAFKHGPTPEIIIVVDKLLTGFDAPRNTVLYVGRSLKEHYRQRRINEAEYLKRDDPSCGRRSCSKQCA